MEREHIGRVTHFRSGARECCHVKNEVGPLKGQRAAGDKDQACQPPCGCFNKTSNASLLEALGLQIKSVLFTCQTDCRRCTEMLRAR